METKTKIDYKTMIAIVCQYFEVTIEQIKERKRHDEIVLPRHIIATLLSINGLSLSKAGLLIDRDHASVLNSKKKINNILNPKFKDKYATQTIYCLLRVKRRFPSANLPDLPGEWEDKFTKLLESHSGTRKYVYIVPSMRRKRENYGLRNHFRLQAKLGNTFIPKRKSFALNILNQ